MSDPLRMRFEKWAIPREFNLEAWSPEDSIDSPRTYLSEWTDDCWLAWQEADRQARAELSAAANELANFGNFAGGRDP